MRRRIPAVTAGFIVVAAMLYSGLWLIASGNVRDGMERWATERRAAGWKVAWDGFSIGGFPFALRARVASPRISGPNAAWDWRGPSVVVTSHPWNLNSPKFAFPGRHGFSVMRNGTLRNFTLTAAEAFGEVRIRAGVAADITATFAEIEILAANGMKITGDAMSLRLVPRHSDPPGPLISIALAGIMLPDGRHAVLGRAVRAFDAELKLLGVAAFKPASRLRLSAALGDWRDGGGTIEIKRLRLVWGGLKFDGDGTVALDAELQPVGAMRARIQGYRALVDGLVGARLIAARDADMVKFVLNIAARATPGGINTVTLPVTIQDRRLFIGPAKLMKLPRIDWKY